MPKRPIVAGLGEVLWDVFPDGARFGGAPANFACHAAGLGAEAFMVSRVGNDALGEQAVETLRELGVDISLLARDGDHPTGTVDIELDEAGKPRYEFAADTAWDHLQWSVELEQLAARCDVVCFGALGQRAEISRRTIRRFLQSTPPDCLRVFDVNLRQDFFDARTIQDSLHLANVLKLNDDELPVVCSMCGIADQEEAAMKALAERFGLRLVALTRGAEGATLLANNEVSQSGALQVSVRDTVGAGDAFTATLVVGMLRGLSLEEINRGASQVAAFVCSQSGATPTLPDEIADKLRFA